MKESKYVAAQPTSMTEDDGSEKSLKGEARQQIVSVAISGSSIETKPGRNPDELAESE